MIFVVAGLPRSLRSAYLGGAQPGEKILHVFNPNHGFKFSTLSIYFIMFILAFAIIIAGVVTLPVVGTYAIFHFLFIAIILLFLGIIPLIVVSIVPQVGFIFIALQSQKYVVTTHRVMYSEVDSYSLRIIVLKYEDITRMNYTPPQVFFRFCILRDFLYFFNPKLENKQLQYTNFYGFLFVAPILWQIRHVPYYEYITKR